MKKFTIEIGNTIDGDKHIGYSSVFRFEDGVEVKNTVLELIDTAIIAADCMKLDLVSKQLESYKSIIGGKRTSDPFTNHLCLSSSCVDRSFARILFTED